MKGDRDIPGRREAIGAGQQIARDDLDASIATAVRVESGEIAGYFGTYPVRIDPASVVLRDQSGGEMQVPVDFVLLQIGYEADMSLCRMAGVELGRRLARLARTHQVVVVTHLPQVAAYADRQLVVNKGTAKGITRSDIRMVGNDERVAELARMLAGMGHTKTGRAHAEELLATAEAEKVG